MAGSRCKLRVRKSSEHGPLRAISHGAIRPVPEQPIKSTMSTLSPIKNGMSRSPTIGWRLCFSSLARVRHWQPRSRSRSKVSKPGATKSRYFLTGSTQCQLSSEQMRSTTKGFFDRPLTIVDWKLRWVVFLIHKFPFSFRLAIGKSGVVAAERIQFSIRTDDVGAAAINAVVIPRGRIHERFDEQPERV